MLVVWVALALRTQDKVSVAVGGAGDLKPKAGFRTSHAPHADQVIREGQEAGDQAQAFIRAVEDGEDDAEAVIRETDVDAAGAAGAAAGNLEEAPLGHDSAARAEAKREARQALRLGLEAARAEAGASAALQVGEEAAASAALALAVGEEATRAEASATSAALVAEEADGAELAGQAAQAEAAAAVAVSDAGLDGAGAGAQAAQANAMIEQAAQLDQQAKELHAQQKVDPKQAADLAATAAQALVSAFVSGAQVHAAEHTKALAAGAALEAAAEQIEEAARRLDRQVDAARPPAQLIELEGGGKQAHAHRFSQPGGLWALIAGFFALVVAALQRCLRNAVSWLFPGSAADKCLLTVRSLELKKEGPFFVCAAPSLSAARALKELPAERDRSRVLVGEGRPETLFADRRGCKLAVYAAKGRPKFVAVADAPEDALVEAATGRGVAHKEALTLVDLLGSRVGQLEVSVYLQADPQLFELGFKPTLPLPFLRAVEHAWQRAEQERQGLGFDGGADLFQVLATLATGELRVLPERGPTDMSGAPENCAVFAFKVLQKRSGRWFWVFRKDEEEGQIPLRAISSIEPMEDDCFRIRYAGPDAEAQVCLAPVARDWLRGRAEWTMCLELLRQHAERKELEALDSQTKQPEASDEDEALNQLRRKATALGSKAPTLAPVQ